MRNWSYLCLFVLFFAGCKSKQRVAERPDPRNEQVVISNRPSNDNPSNDSQVVKPKDPPPNATYAQVVQTYIENYKQIAMDEMQQYGIPASITLAQGILESGAGRGDLTRRANNHFGIKCHRGWTGERVYHDDDELQECFRKYKDPRTSFRDHSLFLTERSRYRNLFSLRQNDYKGWARGLKKAGYATDPRYPNKLIALIEKYDLDQYDRQVLKGKPKGDRPAVATYTVVKGDTLYSISRRFNISVNDLKKYNGLRSNTISIGQELRVQDSNNR